MTEKSHSDRASPNLVIRMDRETYLDLEFYAELAGKDKSKYVRSLIEADLKRQRKKSA